MKLRAASGRAQRASARQQGSGVVPALDTATTLAPTVVAPIQSPTIDSDPATMTVDEDVIPLSRSASSVNLQLQDPSPLTAGNKAKRKDKGKGKEVENPPLRVKEEPKAVSLHTPEPTNNLVRCQPVSPATFFFAHLIFFFSAQQ